MARFTQNPDTFSITFFRSAPSKSARPFYFTACSSLMKTCAGAAAAWLGPGRLQAFFHRGWRRLQGLWLLRRLLRQPGRILVAPIGIPAEADRG